MSKIFAIVGVAIFAGATLLWFNSPYTSSVETTRQNYVSVDDDKITTQDASGAIETPVVEPKSLSTGSEATLIVLPKLQAESAVKSKLCSDVKDVRILFYVNTDSGQYEHSAFPALGSVLF